MSHEHASIPAHLQRSELAVVWQELARRLSRGDSPSSLTLRNLNPPQQQAIADLLGLDRMPGPTMRLSMTKLMNACQFDDPARLYTVAEQLTGPIVDRKLERVSRQRDKDNLWHWIGTQLLQLPYASCGHVEGWVEAQRTSGISHNGLEEHGELYQQMLAVLKQLPAEGQGLAVFAAEVLGDPHALDSNTSLGRLCIDAFCTLNDLPRDRDPDSLRKHWQWAGVTPDGVSSTVLALGLFESADASMSHWLSHSARCAEPVVLTYRQLSKWPVNALASDRYAIVVENPSLLEAAAQVGLTEIPLICTSGQPTLAVRLLINQLGADGATILQHADFDAAGMYITRWLQTHLGTTPWHMTEQAYLNAINALTAPLHSLNKQAIPETPWDTSLQVAMMDQGIFISEEQVWPSLFERIRELTDAQSPGIDHCRFVGTAGDAKVQSDE